MIPHQNMLDMVLDLTIDRRILFLRMMNTVETIADQEHFVQTKVRTIVHQ
jgi:hypothetical protein